MKKKLFYAVIVLLFCTVIGCNKDETTVANGVEIYLIDSFDKIGDGYQIDEKSVVTKDSPLIGYSEILSYDSTKHVFQLSENGISAIENLEHSVFGVAFAVKANSNLIYTGYFWPGFSSASCNWVVIDPLFFKDNQIKVSIGYPGLIEGIVVPDKRNDQRIIDVLKQDNKLK